MNNKPKGKKSRKLTASGIVKAILIALACIVLLAGIIGRAVHFYRHIKQ